jgi:hypothetical protein
MANLSPLHILVAIALAVVVVVMPMGHILLPIPWLMVVAVVWKGESKRDRGASTVATYTVVTAVIIVAAILAPVKTTDRVLNRPLVLPRTEMTLAEMDRENNFEKAEWLPRYIYVTARSDNAEIPIRFRKTDITLREFVNTIESQSELRHRFGHCGNGSSILFGGDCCFGLSIR